MDEYIYIYRERERERYVGNYLPNPKLELVLILYV